MKAPSLLVFQERTNSKTGEVTYHHQMLGAALVHPDLKQVIPLAPEAIIKQDGENKNDCERNASKRLLQKIRDEHPHKKLIVVEDGLASNAPHIRLLKRLNMRSILGAKPDDHEHLFGEVAQAEAAGRATTLRWTDGSILKRFSWVTDLTITPNNARHLVRGGRSRWKIENETFNTLKNQGYQFGHNFGYGTQNLSTNFAMLMMLAFLVDQTQELCCSLFQAGRQKRITRRSLWDH